MTIVRGLLHRSALARFGLLFGGLFLFASLAMSGLVYSSVAEYTRQRERDTIDTDLRGLRDTYAQGGLNGLASVIERRLAEGDLTRFYLLVDAAGDKLAGNFDLWPNTDPGGPGLIFFADAAGTRRYAGLASLLAGGPRVLIAHDRAEHDALLNSLLRQMLVPVGVALVVALFVGVALLRRMMARISAVNATCSAVEAGDLTRRVPGASQRDEFGEIARHINAMLARIGVLMRGVHDLSDHIAHEMRTPLARLRSRLERGKRAAVADMAAPQAMQTVAVFDDAIAETQQIIDVFTALLDIAATEAQQGDNSNLMPVDFAEVLRDAVDVYEGVAEERGIILELAAPRPVHVLGEPMLLLRMIANVLDNAIKFAPDASLIHLDAHVQGCDAVVAIADAGPGMAADFANSAFDRFVRAPATQSRPGHGLGLTLVRAVALRHGMKVTLEPNNPGLRVVFVAPLADLPET